jgi:ectoine hydroxylase-related dioxygenase (phytanoyl-CoA dioxygenase family)
MSMPTGVVLPDLDASVVAGAAASVSGAVAFRLRQSGAEVTYRVEGGSIVVTEGVGDAPIVVVLDDECWHDLTQQIRTSINLFLSGALTFERGSYTDLATWEPALRSMHSGVPVYDPRRTDLRGRDPQAAYTAATDDAELAEQLHTMGYLHLRGVFSREEMDLANAEIDRLAAMARPGDDQSWWVTDADGNEVVCRLVYATMRSSILAELENDPRVARLGALFDPTARIAADRMEGAAVLLKVPGRTKGLSNIPWHQDCGMGGHALLCPSLSVGIQITGSNADTGNLHVIPGSQGQSMHHGWEVQSSDIPVVSIDTEPGDVTVHVQDVMHASPKPLGAGGRRTMYVSFYPAQVFERIGPGEAFNDLVRNRTGEISAMAGRG